MDQDGNATTLLERIAISAEGILTDGMVLPGILHLEALNFLPDDNVVDAVSKSASPNLQSFMKRVYS